MVMKRFIIGGVALLTFTGCQASPTGHDLSEPVDEAEPVEQVEKEEAREEKSDVATETNESSETGATREASSASPTKSEAPSDTKKSERPTREPVDIPAALQPDADRAMYWRDNGALPLAYAMIHHADRRDGWTDDERDAVLRSLEPLPDDALEQVEPFLLAWGSGMRREQLAELNKDYARALPDAWAGTDVQLRLNEFVRHDPSSTPVPPAPLLSRALTDEEAVRSLVAEVAWMHMAGAYAMRDAQLTEDEYLFLQGGGGSEGRAYEKVSKTLDERIDDVKRWVDPIVTDEERKTFESLATRADRAGHTSKEALTARETIVRYLLVDGLHVDDEWVEFPLPMLP